MNQTERPAAVSAAPPAAVLDTNAVLDWLVFQDPGINALAAAVEAAAVRWIASPQMREELLRALSYSALAKWKPDCERTLTAFDQWAIVCAEPSPTRAGPLVCSDPEDQVFIDLALSRQARWLVTHDHALHKLARHAARQGVQILHPRDWPGLA